MHLFGFILWKKQKMYTLGFHKLMQTLDLRDFKTIQKYYVNSPASQFT